MYGDEYIFVGADEYQVIEKRYNEARNYEEKQRFAGWKKEKEDKDFHYDFERSSTKMDNCAEQAIAEYESLINRRNTHPTVVDDCELSIRCLEKEYDL